MPEMRELKTSQKPKIPYAKDLVLYLNGRDRFGGDDLASAASRRRIRELFRAVNHALEDVAKGLGGIHGVTPSEFARLVENLDKRLAKYPMVTTFMCDWNGEYSLESVFGSGLERVVEAFAAHGIINLAKAQKLHRVQLCVCGDWFLAQRDNQRSCSAGCRHKLYEQTEAYKDRRRTYMREYYALRKTGKVK